MPTTRPPRSRTARLVPVLCRGCGAYLGTTLPGAEAWCPGCRDWTPAEDPPPPVAS